MLQLIAIAVPLIYGYILALVVFMAVTFAAAEIGRTMMANEGKPRFGYYFISALSWMLAALAGCLVAANLAPFSPVTFLIALALVLLFLLVRISRKIKGLAPAPTIFISSAGLFLGALAAWQIARFS